MSTYNIFAKMRLGQQVAHKSPNHQEKFPNFLYSIALFDGTRFRVRRQLFYYPIQIAILTPSIYVTRVLTAP